MEKKSKNTCEFISFETDNIGKSVVLKGGETGVIYGETDKRFIVESSDNKYYQVEKLIK